MIKACKFHILFVLILLLTSCSTQKNTGVRRFYHNLTSRYNVLFNGEQSYLEGMTALQDAYPDNYSQILPVFLYDNKDNLSSVGGNMNRTIEKSTILLTKHSITVKPEFNPDKQMTDKQREFYNQYEFNKWADEAYLYMGKAQFHLHEFDIASQSFTYLLSNFSHTIAAKKARIWQAKLALIAGRYKEVEGVLTEMQEDAPDIYKELDYLIEPTWADLYLKQDKYNEALPHLERSYETAKNKYYRTRYAFITAQVYQEVENFVKASEYYEYAIKLNPPYEMTFNAKINMALSYQSGIGGRREIETRLFKMLKDDKNIDFQDQIFYALGNIAYVEGEKARAVEYYRKSINASVGNTNQLALSNLTLADIYYDQPDYFKAQALYDSTINIISADYPDYQIIYNKSISLTSLVDNLSTVQLLDSVLALAVLPAEELNYLIDDLIEQNIRLEEERKAKALDEMQEASFTQTQFDKVGDAKWYFYSPNTVQKGRQDFKKRWGNRKLEDNWRRKNKSAIEFEEEASFAENEVDTVKVEGEDDYRNRAYYLKDIPFEEEEQLQARADIALALYQAGSIYYSDLKDFENATKTYEELLARYPQFDNRLSVYYDLYIIGRETNNTALVNRYKAKIVSEFPHSIYAKALSNPNYMAVVNAQEHEVLEKYGRIYNLYSKGNYTRANVESRKAMEDYPDHELFPKFDYINTVTAYSAGKTQEYITQLTKFTERYPKHELSENAQTLISYLTESRPEVARKIETKKAKEIYAVETNTPHFVLLTLPVKAKSNQLTFNILGFNVDNYSEANLKTKKAKLTDEVMLVTVSPFKNAKQAKDYMDKLAAYPNLWKDVKQGNTTLSIISEGNYEKLLKNKEMAQYILFFNDTY